jgi:hypothetical protein
MSNRWAGSVRTGARWVTCIGGVLWLLVGSRSAGRWRWDQRARRGTERSWQRCSCSGGAAAPATPAVPCVCAAGTPCCDGCNLLPDGARCDVAGPAQCVEGGACRAGLCTTKIKPTYCLISNVCYREGAPAPRYDCMHCLPSRAQDRFSPRPAGTRCDDKVFCNGTDRCDAYGQCSDSIGSPCPADCRCDEFAETCSAPQPSSARESGRCQRLNLRRLRVGR